MIDPTHPLAELLRRDKRYHLDAYVFVFDALRYAHEQLGLGRSPGSSDDTVVAEEIEEDRHVTGQQLCEAIRQFAIKQYGGMAKSVLGHWGVHSTGDFGEIVFNLISIGQMRKTDSDRREDFNGVFDFEEVLETKAYLRNSATVDQRNGPIGGLSAGRTDLGLEGRPEFRKNTS